MRYVPGHIYEVECMYMHSICILWYKHVRCQHNANIVYIHSISRYKYYITIAYIHTNLVGCIVQVALRVRRLQVNGRRNRPGGSSNIVCHLLYVYIHKYFTLNRLTAVICMYVRIRTHICLYSLWCMYICYSKIYTYTYLVLMALTHAIASSPPAAPSE